MSYCDRNWEGWTYTANQKANCPDVIDVSLILLAGGRRETSTFLKSRSPLSILPKSTLLATAIIHCILGRCSDFLHFLPKVLLLKGTLGWRLLGARSQWCLQRAVFWCFLSSTVESASCGTPGERRESLKSIGKTGMAQLCKDRNYSVLHVAVSRENGCLVKKRKRRGEWDAMGDECLQQNPSPIQRLGVVRLIEGAAEKQCRKKCRGSLEGCPVQCSNRWFHVCM